MTDRDWNRIKRHVHRLAEHHSPADISSMLGLPFDDVLEALGEGARPARAVTVICHRTAEAIHCRSFRAAYFQICKRGLTEWSWHFTEDYHAWLKAAS